MSPITFPLLLGDKGSAIVNFQNGLLFLLRRQWFQLDPREQQKLETILLEEQQRQFFSDNATYQLLKRFWEQTGVQPQIEGVDQATAETLNKVLRELGAFSDISDELLPEINKKLDAIAGNTERLGSIDNQLTQHGGQLGKIEGNLSNQNNQLGSIDSKLGEQTTRLGSIDSKLGDHTSKLNSIDSKLGNLGGDRNPNKFLTLNDRGAEVKALQTSLSQLNFTIPENELNEQVFGVGTRDALIQLQTNYKLDRTGVFDDASKVALERAIAALNVLTHRLEGRIVFEHGLPAEGVTLKLYNRGFGGQEVSLGEVKTDNRGFYALPYQVNGKAVNLEIRAIDAQGKEISLSDTKRNASKNEVLNLVAPTAVQPLAAEYQRLTRDLSQQIDSLQQLGSAQENGDRQDLTLLHQATGWDARLIALASSAVKLSAETGIPQDALYAMFRVGLPTDKDQLAQVSGQVIQQAIAKAREAGIVSLTDPQVAGVKATFDTFAHQNRRTEIAPGAVSSMGEFLDRTGLVDTDRIQEKTIFADLHFKYQGAELWDKAKESGIADAKINSLKLQGKFAYLTLNNVSLAQKLQKEIPSLDRISELVDKDFYLADTWKSRLIDLADNKDEILQTLIPPIYAGEKIGDRLDAYAADLARKVRLSFPTKVIHRAIEKDELRLGIQHSELKAPVRQFLQNAQSIGFELGRTPIAAFIKQNKTTVLNGIEPSQIQNAIEGTKLVQRLYQISPTDEALKVLLEQEFTSAQDVVAFPSEKFIDRFGKFFPSLDEARLVYRKAEQVTTVTFNFFTAAKQLDRAPSTHVTSPSIKIREAAKNELIKHYPTMENLFGSLDFCDCEHCRSVLSPAAYFVDLLDFLDYKVDLNKSRNPETLVWQNFLKDWKAKHGTAAYPFKNPTEQTNFLNKWRKDHPGQRDPNTEKTPYEVLIERRPDLPNLPLTCENTQTVLPYIDVVNEILEYYVANDRLAADSGHDTGLATTPELLAEPQNVLAAAYTKLQEAKYPLTLPFDLWLETVRRFFNYFETPLAEVLEVLRPTDELFPPTTEPKPYYRNAIWAESLSISPSEYGIFTNFDVLKWYELYGYATANDATVVAEDENGQRLDLNSAKSLSRRLGVSYKELVDLVRTEFVNPELEQLVILRKLRLDTNDSGIDIDDVLRYKGQAGYSALTSDELAVFQQRLQKLTAKFASSGFNAETWLDNAWNDGKFNQILVLFDPNASCNFDLTTPRYANENPADDLVFLKLNLFVRLWRKLGWTIAELDRALQVFIPATILPLTGMNIGAALKTALVYLAHLKVISDRLNFGKNSRIQLLTLWSNLSTTGNNSLYAQLFLKPSILKNDPIFDAPLGNYLSNYSILLKAHLPALQGALNLTAEDISRILNATDRTLETAALSLENVSLLYRYRLLAKALKLSISDSIALKKISGLDPLKPLKTDGLTIIDDDYPFTQTIKFIEIVEKVKQSGFKPEDLDYLLRHNFDPVGKYRVNSDVVLGLVKTLATEISRIHAENAIPADAISVTDDLLRQKLAFVLPADVTETFMAMWTGTIEYEVLSQEKVLPANKLDPNAISDSTIRVTYDSVHQVQRLAFRGVVLLDAKKTQLTTANPSPLFANLLNAVQIKATATAKEFFNKQFAGFLQDPGDFDLLFTPISDTLTDAEKQKPMRRKREKLVHTFFPFLQTKLIRQFVVQTLSTNLNADLNLTEALLTNTELLTDPTDSSKPLLDRFTTAGLSGISASFFTSNDETGTPTTKLISAADTTAKPTGTNSARLEGYFEVPTAGDYRFFVVFDELNGEAELRLAHLPDPLLRGKATEANQKEISQFTELKPGILYQFTLDIRNLNGGNATLLIQGETLPKDSLKQLTLYPQTVVDRIHRAHTLITKIFQLIQGFGFSDREIRYLLTHPADFYNLNLSQLPTRINDNSPAIATALFHQFLRLADYAQLKYDLAIVTDDLITLFENARRRYPGSADPDLTKTAHLDRLYKHIAELTRREKAIVKAVSEHLEFAVQSSIVGDELQIESPNFAQKKGIGRLWEVLQMVEKIGIPVGSIARWATPSPDFAIARDLRNAVKSRYETETWQQIAQPIFDKLRQSQRDALVAYIMPRHGFDRLEQLFEYFLIDPGMEPIVQTSRIRLAISSVQLFIQRCLLNLEPQIQPTAINSKHWQWMKRYRVWEANRKIFLYPENWLEPEFRDDKTHLFEELEGTLLQSDISNDLAEDAFFNYLKKLEELARLEIVTMYLEEKPLDPASNTLHVIGRTYSLPHKYFYRRYAHQMWTPWEPVTTEIEGDHLVAVVWRDRLHLFWVTFLEKASANSSGAGTAGNEKLASASFNKIVAASNQALQRQVEVQLNWSEYFQGKWTTRESGGFGNSISVSVGNSFTSQQTFIYVTKEYESGEERAVRISLDSKEFFKWIAAGEGFAPPPRGNASY
ncbi:MAG: peptidoglycan-binding protein [Microcoleus sp. PH2017_15_JOR_U_A]|uniref:neuraminidase-like domain-containing protein n=1 Tax=unclassified Microcoleus TaxID=2642155 RepID=UPI001DAF4797|nr:MULTISPECIES: neuraminidase-like domain-containing protein [unclassified Microcoleus]MCC3474017.1 peptidoglycan-binding protein [Microcoleus sp. PH2017_13_LAR_U_A]MCC3486429.1 peptidoglycan-binding protein [Microcoleus sp. PH2017_14_LAR_D_A]MCC3498494.1 peptidoglycan-binding protein [Microcoleus sp. PH2017_15_JOR_U_A]MCC3598930.1 peptidoglycan-binding protein [Microcoleus sp. PH2017_26_ELK_O_A]MCC3624016.1 peptidoglycan-binding protein [Microcoleus sp. PH2017_36_ELK_O_B]